MENFVSYFKKIPLYALAAISLLLPNPLHGLENKAELLKKAQEDPFVTQCIKHQELANEGPCCSCNQPFNVDQKITIIDGCHHLVHTSCISNELTTCPTRNCNTKLKKIEYTNVLSSLENRPDQKEQFQMLLDTVVEKNQEIFESYPSLLIVNNDSSKAYDTPYRNILFNNNFMYLAGKSFLKILISLGKALPIIYLTDNSKIEFNFDLRSIKTISKSHVFASSGQFDKDEHNTSINSNLSKILRSEKIQWGILSNIFYSCLFHIVSIEILVNHSHYRQILRSGVSFVGRSIDTLRNMLRWIKGSPQINGSECLNLANLSEKEKDELFQLTKDLFENYIAGHALYNNAFFFPFIVGMHTCLLGILWTPIINTYYLNLCNGGPLLYALGKTIYQNYNNLRGETVNGEHHSLLATLKKFFTGCNRNQNTLQTPQQPQPPQRSMWGRLKSYFGL